MSRKSEALHTYLDLHVWKDFKVEWDNGNTEFFRYCEGCGMLQMDNPYEDNEWVVPPYDAEPYANEEIGARRVIMAKLKARGCDISKLRDRWTIRWKIRVE